MGTHLVSDNPVFRLIVAGTRTFSDYPILRAKLDALLAGKVRQGVHVVIIQGGARGADALAARYAIERGYECVDVPADWDAHGKAAGPIRNKQMSEMGEALVAFWDEVSRGTADMIRQAEQKGIPIRVVRF